MDTTRSLALAVAIALAGSPAAQAATNTPPCQTQLEAALAKITSSGPFRVVETKTVNGKPTQLITTEFEAPGKLHTSVKSML